MRAIVTVVGKDKVGILARISGECAAVNANVLEVTQSVLQNMFAMSMLIDISNINTALTQFADHMNTVGNEMGMAVHVMHEDIFNSMHRI